MSRRNVLVVAPFVPAPPDFGGALRVFHLLKQLARTDDVSLVVPATHAEREQLDVLGEFCDVTFVPAAWTPRQPATTRKRLAQAASVAGGAAYLARSVRMPTMQAVIDRLFLTRQFDLVQFEFSQMASFRLPRPTPTVIDIHNAEFAFLQRVAATSPSSLKRAFNTLEYRKVRRLERRLWSQATLCVTTSDIDAALVSALVTTPVHVVPNGVDASAFRRLDPPPERPTIVFTGTLRHAPNADGIRWYLRHVHPRVLAQAPDARLAIVGADPPPDIRAAASPNIQVAGYVEDIRPWLHDARAAIVPLHAGGGTRLKILEAFAAGVPVVSTNIGAEGLEVIDGSDILLADEPEAFAAAVVRVLRDAACSQRLATRAEALVQERYDWSHVATALRAAHARALEQFAHARNDERGMHA